MYPKINILLCYSRGVAEYTNFNLKNNRWVEIQSMLNSVLDEIIELVEAVHNLNIKDVFYEFFDVWFCFLKLIFIIFLPHRWIKSPYLWLIIFPFVFPAAIKYGIRYQNNMCVRSKRNHNNPTHKCNYHE